MKALNFAWRRAVLATFILATAAGVAQASIMVITSRPVETDFVDWSAISTQLGGTSMPLNPTPLGTVHTNGNVNFGFSQLPHFGGAFNTLHLSHFGSLDSGCVSCPADLVGENGSSNPFDLIFDPTHPFQMIGFDLQNNDGFTKPVYTVTLGVYSGATLLGTLTINSPSGNGAVTFVGVTSDTANITEIKVSPTGGVPFAIDRVSLNDGAVVTSSTPEPGTLGMLFLGGVALFGFARKRRV